MNSFYDYIMVRIYRWYNSFKNEPALFSAKLIVTLHQSFIAFSILMYINDRYYHLSSLPLKIIGVSIMAAFYARLHFRYSDEDFFKGLLKKWSHEKKTTKVIKGLMIPIVILIPIVIAIII